MSKINVYSSSASNAIKVFDANSTGLKPDNAILVTTGTEPSNAIQINIGDKKWSSIAVNFGGQEPTPPGPTWETTTIGEQVWMAENLKYDDGGDGIYHSACVVNGVDFGEQYYYSSNAVERITYNISSVYPGWHLSDLQDVELLKNEVNNDSNPLRTVDGWVAGWEGTDLYGFHGEPLGEGSYSEITGFSVRNDSNNGAAGRGCRYALGPQYYWGLNGRPNYNWVASGKWTPTGTQLYQIRLVKDHE